MLNFCSFQEIDRFIAQNYSLKQRPRVDNYSVIVPVPATADGSSIDVPFRLNGNADFLICSLGFVNVAGLAVAQSTIQIVENGSNEKLFDSAVSIRTICSTQAQGDFPGIRRIARGSALTLTFSNVGGGVSANFFAMHGVNVYVYG